MRTRLTLLPALLLVLLMQPLALLHGLSHLPRGWAGPGPQSVAAMLPGASAESQPGARDTGDDSACALCLALGALALAAPLAPLALRLLQPAQGRALRPGRCHRGGSAAGFHARGPPSLH
ncbi:MAG: hypothetical protein HY855_05280 [Burkholderiales bacterium]|nr:hypothetical protein [Burkholderiales bacterium]